MMLRTRDHEPVHDRQHVLQGPRALLHATIALLVLVPVPSHATTADRLGEIRETTRDLWESRGALGFQCVEYFGTDRGERDPSKGTLTYTIFLQNEGTGDARILKSSFSAFSTSPRGEISLLPETRHDGKHRVDVQWKEQNRKHPGMITRGIQADDSKIYNGIMCSAIWIMMPFHKPIHRLLEQGITELRDDVNTDGLRVVRIKGTHEGKDFDISLLPSRDWWPQRVTMGSGNAATTWEVKTFQKFENRWFPELGTFTAVTEDRQRVDKWFRLSSLSMTPKNAREFSMPAPEHGTYVHDDITKKYYRVSLKNDPKRHSPSSSKGPTRDEVAKTLETDLSSRNDLILAESDPGGPVAWIALSLLVSFVSFLGVVVYKARARRRLRDDEESKD